MQISEQATDLLEHLDNNPLSMGQLLALAEISEVQKSVLGGDAKAWLMVLGASFLGVAAAIGYDPVAALQTARGIVAHRELH
jgi:hypothetical protein